MKLNGVLELLFAEDVNVRDQVGRSWKIFDWAGVSPAGRFALESDPRLQWGLGRLYSDGVVELAAIVPEPMSMPLLLMAAGGVAGTCRQRRRVRPLERQRLV